MESKIVLIRFFKSQLSEWQSLLKDKFTFKVMPLIFPTDNALEWRKLFKPCAAQRLFLPVHVNYIGIVNI